VRLVDQETQDQVANLDQQDSQAMKVWLVKWEKRVVLVSQEVSELLDQEEEKVALELQDLEEDLVLVDPSEKTVSKEPLDQLELQVFGENKEKQEPQELQVFLE